MSLLCIWEISKEVLLRYLYIQVSLPLSHLESMCYFLLGIQKYIVKMIKDHSNAVLSYCFHLRNPLPMPPFYSNIKINPSVIIVSGEML